MGGSDAYYGIVPQLPTRPAPRRASGGAGRREWLQGGCASPPPHARTVRQTRGETAPDGVFTGVQVCQVPGLTEGPLIRLLGSLHHIAPSGPKAGAAVWAHVCLSSSRSSSQRWVAVHERLSERAGGDIGQSGLCR